MERKAKLERKTKETDIKIELNIDGSGVANIDTGLKFFDHMLEALTKHGFFDLTIKVDGDIEVDDHHTVEDTGILLGECFKKALGNKVGINRMGYAIVPMDESLATVAVDISGRNYIVFDAPFTFQYVGDINTQNIKHFIESFANSSLMNINIKAEGENDHHICEAIFKSLSRALNDATKITHDQILSTKGTL